MKLAGNGLYVEEYIKCANCGILIYEPDLPASVEVKDQGLFCSQWCVDWAEARRKRQMENP